MQLNGWAGALVSVFFNAFIVPIGDRVGTMQNPYRRCENANRDHVLYSVLSIRLIVGRGPIARAYRP
jgi:hypothetical protein